MNLTETRGVIITSSPVFGLRANRSDCCQGTKDPNPFMEIDSPSRIPFATTVGNAFTTALTTFFGNPVSISHQTTFKVFMKLWHIITNYKCPCCQCIKYTIRYYTIILHVIPMVI